MQQLIVYISKVDIPLLYIDTFLRIARNLNNDLATQPLKNNVEMPPVVLQNLVD